MGEGVIFFLNPEICNEKSCQKHRINYEFFNPKIGFRILIQLLEFQLHQTAFYGQAIFYIFFNNPYIIQTFSGARFPDITLMYGCFINAPLCRQYGKQGGWNVS